MLAWAGEARRQAAVSDEAKIRFEIRMNGATIFATRGVNDAAKAVGLSNQ